MWSEPKRNICFGEPRIQTLEGFKELIKLDFDKYADEYAEEFF